MSGMRVACRGRSRPDFEHILQNRLFKQARCQKAFAMLHMARSKFRDPCPSLPGRPPIQPDQQHSKADTCPGGLSRWHQRGKRRLSDAHCIHCVLDRMHSVCSWSMSRLTMRFASTTKVLEKHMPKNCRTSYRGSAAPAVTVSVNMQLPGTMMLGNNTNVSPKYQLSSRSSTTESHTQAWSSAHTVVKSPYVAGSHGQKIQALLSQAINGTWDSIHATGKWNRSVVLKKSTARLQLQSDKHWVALRLSSFCCTGARAL